MLTVRSRAYVVPTLLFLGAAFALANGMGYGCGNLRQYLLHGLHTLDPTFLANDWFTTQTQSHHAAFNALILLWAGLLPLPQAFALANAVAAALYVTCIYFLSARFYRTPIVVTALAVFMIVFAPKSHIGLTSIMGIYFQPSTIGAVGLLAGLTCLIYQRYKNAGLVFLVAGLFHVNYLVWIAVICGAVLLVNLRRIGLGRALCVIGPIGLAVVYHLPFVIASRSPQQLLHAAPAARILHDIYMPYHSRPLTWGPEPFICFAAMLAAGALALKFGFPDRRPGRMVRSILAALLGILALGILLTMVVQVDTMALIFPYRMAPFLILAAQIAVAGAVARTAQVGRLSLPGTLAWWAVLGALLYAAGVTPYGLLCLGIFVTMIFAGRLARQVQLSLPVIAGLLAGLVAVLWGLGAGRNGMVCVILCAAAALAWRIMRRTAFGRRDWTVTLLFGRVATPLLIAVSVMRLGAVRKDLLGPPPPADEQLLYDWCGEHTARDEVFIIPPMLGGFRLGAERAVVADWKCMPILPKDTVEWHRRLATVCGAGPQSYPEAEAGFGRIDSARAEQLAREYRARYLVTYGDRHRGHLDGLRRLYENPTFAVFALDSFGHPNTPAPAADS